MKDKGLIKKLEEKIEDLSRFETERVKKVKLTLLKEQLEFLEELEGHWEIPDDERAEAINIIRNKIKQLKQRIKLLEDG